MKVAVFILCQLLVCGASLGAEPRAPAAEIALRNTLFVRTDAARTTFGREDLDIQFWQTTSYLLAEPSHSNAIKAVDVFIAAHCEKTLIEPWRRAL